MQTISQQLRDLDNRIFDRGNNLEMYSEGQWGGTHSEWQAFNDAGVECEVGEFLYAFLRMIKPSKVLETGTHWGVSASYMGFALKHNNKGQLDTHEFLPEIYEVAKKRFHRLDLENQINPHFGDVGHLQLNNEYDFMFLDTEPQTRFAELVKFYPHLKEGGYVFIHDLHRHMHQDETLRNNPDHPNQPFWPYGELPEAFKQLLRDGKLKTFHFSTPRGLTMLYKPHTEDYNGK